MEIVGSSDLLTLHIVVCYLWILLTCCCLHIEAYYVDEDIFVFI